MLKLAEEQRLHMEECMRKQEEDLLNQQKEREKAREALREEAIHREKLARRMKEEKELIRLQYEQEMEERQRMGLKKLPQYRKTPKKPKKNKKMNAIMTSIARIISFD
jgi:hypothetical protein